MIRFFGTERALELWREVVAKRVGKVVQPTSFKKDRYGIRFFADCDLTDEDRIGLMQDWYSEAFIINPRDGQRLWVAKPGVPWNHCITFEERK